MFLAFQAPLVVLVVPILQVFLVWLLLQIVLVHQVHRVFPVFSSFPDLAQEALLPYHMYHELPMGNYMSLLLNPILCLSNTKTDIQYC